MKKLAILLIPIVFASQISLSAKHLIPAAWLQEYRDAVSVVTLLFRGLQENPSERQRLEPESDCPLYRGARVYAYAWSSGEFSEAQMIEWELRQAQVQADMHRIMRKLRDVSKRRIPFPDHLRIDL